MDEHSDCPTLHTQMWSAQAYLHTGPHMLTNKVYEIRLSLNLLTLFFPFSSQPVGDESQAKVVELVGQKPGDSSFHL